MKRVLLAAFAVSLLVIPAFADGPETGTVTGIVTSPDGTPLPGVKVTLTGDRGAKETFTEPNGQYRFALLVPGDYKVQAELDTMSSPDQPLNLSAGGKAEINLRLSLSTAEEITVTSEAPMVDKFNVTAGSTVTAEVGQEVAGTTRTYYGVINAMPGVTADAQNDDIQQTRPSVNGTHFADNAVFIDGVDTTFAKFGGSRVYLPTTAVTEVSMEAGGSSAEYGRSIGSQTNVIVKSGTNRYHVDALIQEQQVDWGSDYDLQPSLTVRETQPRVALKDGSGGFQTGYPADWFQRTPLEEEGGSTGYEFSAGGPLKRDKAWFFVGWSDFDDAFTERLLGGDPYDVSLQNEARIFKFNIQPQASHSLSISYIDTPAFRNYFNQQSFDYWTPTPHQNDSELFTANWNYSISSNLFLESKLASQVTQEDKFLACDSIVPADCLALKQQDRGPLAGHSATNTSGGDTNFPLRFPANPAAGPFWPGNNFDVYRDGNNLGAWHNGWILSDGFGFNEFPRDQANLALTQFVGANHELKWGFDYQSTKWEGSASRTSIINGFNFDSRNAFGWENAGVGNPFGFLAGIQLPEDSCSLLRNTGTSPTNPTVLGGTTRGRSCYWVDQNAPELEAIRGSGDAEMRDTALYVRDRFTVGDHWTFNLGLRGELQEGFNDIRRKVVDSTYVDPRLSVTYDVKGDGKLLFSFNAGQYHAMLNQAWIAGGSQESVGMHDMWNGYTGHVLWLFCDPHEALAFCNKNNGIDRGEVGQAGYNFRWEEIIPGRMWEAIDAGIFNHSVDPYYKEEFIIGAEWQFSRNWAMDIKYIDWNLEDMMFSNTQIDQLGRNIGITGNYKNLPTIVRSLRDARVANGLPAGVSDETIANFQQAENGYEGLQIQLNRRYANGFAIYNNISFSETSTTGAGAWWNNTNSDYGKNFEVTLTQDHIDQCNGRQDGRTVPVDCTPLQQFIGQTASTVNRLGPNHAYDREVIFNSFGFKVWNFGQHNLTLGGHFTFQTGTPWHRSEGASAVSLDPRVSRGTPNNGVGINVVTDGSPFTTACPAGITCTGQTGVSFDGRTSDEYTLNLSGAYGLPLGGKLRGELRVEALNVTNQQRQRDFDGRGEVYPVRRFFQRPRQLRASFKLSF